ncbi:uncharacterized protein [Garra rufa]|uniref:uncharacterized protein n=1 Tax=Garra rufa TaxID=137080 RepID=UPI003CCECE91
MRTFGELFNLFVCVILSAYSAETAVIYVENGKNVTLDPHIQVEPEEILWTFNGNKLAECDFTEFHEYGQFKRRSSIEFTTGKLTVHQMTRQDNGIYRSVIQIDGRQHNSQNEVQVIDAVQEPNVTCTLNKITKSKTLFCSVSSQIKASYEWTGSHLVQHSGQELPISNGEEPDSVFTCTVKNEVSQKKTSFALKDCPTDIPHPENITENENINLSVLLFIIGAIILIAVAVAIYVIYKKRNNGRSGDLSKDGTQNNLMSKLPEMEEQIHLKSVSQADHVSVNNGKLNANEEGVESENDEEEENEDVKQSLINSRNAENNEEIGISEVAEDVTQFLKKSPNAENNAKPDIGEDVDESEKNEETGRIINNESENDSEQRNSYIENGENKEKETTDAEIMSNKRDSNGSSKAETSDQRSKSGEDPHNYEDDD